MTSKDSKESYKCTGKKLSPTFTIICKPCKITTHFYYPQMFVSGTPSVFFADVLVDILGLLNLD